MRRIAKGVAPLAVSRSVLFMHLANASADAYSIPLDDVLYCPGQDISLTFKAQPPLHEDSYIELHGPTSPNPADHGYTYNWHTIGDDASGELDFSSPLSSAGLNSAQLGVTTESWFTMYDFQRLGDGPNPAEKIVSTTFSVDPNEDCTHITAPQP